MSEDQIAEFAKAFVDQVRHNGRIAYRMVQPLDAGVGPGGLLSVTVVATEDFDEAKCEQHAADMARLAVMGMAHERGDFDQSK